MWDWVGGRFSLWSAVGLSVALAIGNDNFRELLEGAAAMDAHFHTAPFGAICQLFWRCLAFGTVIFWRCPRSPFCLTAKGCAICRVILQQLEMESNGKSVTRAGEPINYDTAPALFGECGTVGQHSFHQWLHQGSDAVSPPISSASPVTI